MTVFYMDTSAALKRYVAETGSQWVISITDPASGNFVYLVRIAAVEIVSAVVRRQRGGSILASDATRILADARRDLSQQYRNVNVTATLVDRAVLLAEKHGLRGYDAVHLAAAIEIEQDLRAAGTPIVFVSSDDELNNAAKVEGLAVDDPRSHP